MQFHWSGAFVVVEGEVIDGAELGETLGTKLGL